MSRQVLLGFFGLCCSVVLVACSSSTPSGPRSTGQVSAIPDPEPGAPIFAPKAFGKPDTTVTGADPIVLPVCHVTIIPTNKCDIPSPEEGQVAWVGVELTTADQNVSPNEIYQHPRTKKLYRMLKPNQYVKKDQLIALLDDSRAHSDSDIAIAALEGAKKEADASEKTVFHIKALLDAAKYGFSRNVIPQQDVTSAEANVARYTAECEAKRAAIKKAEPELVKANERLSKHEIRAPFDGQIAQIYKNQKEGVKQNESIFQLVNFERLRVEGFLERQYLGRVKEGMTVQIEPTLMEAPISTQSTFHRGKAITALTVSQNTKLPFILSAGEDSQVVVWDRTQVRHGTWRHPGIVRTIATTGSGVKDPLALTGCEDGIGRIWDLKKISNDPVVTLKDRHDGGVKAAAFSPDGTLCVTADGVRNLYLWETATGKQIYRFPQKHNDFVTVLYFLPQCRVVSIGKDNTVNVWMIGKDAAALEKEKSIPYRTGEVGCLGMTEDGNRLLVDNAKTKLHMVSLSDGQTERVLNYPIEGAQFRTFALFSPEIGPSKQRLLMTASNNNGEVQIWRMPSATERGSEVAHLSLPQNGTPICAAFSPISEGGFVVVGTKQGEVSLWNMPSEADMNHRWVGTITQIDAIVDTSGKSVKISAEFDNSKDERFRLRPGTTATLVIRPLEK